RRSRASAAGASPAARSCRERTGAGGWRVPAERRCPAVVGFNEFSASQGFVRRIFVTWGTVTKRVTTTQSTPREESSRESSRRGEPSRNGSPPLKAPLAKNLRKNRHDVAGDARRPGEGARESSDGECRCRGSPGDEPARAHGHPLRAQRRG